MQILIRNNGVFKDVEIRGTESRIELGLHDDADCRALAKTLLMAASQLVQNINDDLSDNIDDLVNTQLA